ncbi:MAG: M23 family metallopeptidase [Nitrospirae bacterium]|nr:M23 family metallopeptidase [Nitrospirota bacterium]
MGPRRVKQGDVLALTFPLRAAEGVAAVGEFVGRFHDRETPVFPVAGGVGVLLGVDMEDVAGTSDFVLERRKADAPVTVARVAVTILPGDFGVQKLSLPQTQVDLDAETVERVEDEQRTMLATMRPVTPRVWKGEFVLPSEGSVQRTFGLRRVINGQPRRPHTGEDITAPSGAPVLAINEGTVQLVADHFFSGKSIVVDHGLGLYSMYFHLSAVTVHPGDRVAKSQVIGAVGASGRASGPHLHWGVRLNGARVNPLSLATAVASVADNLQ